MKTAYKITFLLLPVTVIFSGCSIPQGHVAYAPMSGYEQAYQRSAAATRFEDNSPQGSSVKSIIELSEKYGELSKETSSLRQNNQQLSSENDKLKEKVVTLETKLTKTQDELTEANKLLMEMIVELNNWKTNVLGFRDEIIAAETTQLKALFDILTVLGAKEYSEYSTTSKTTLQPITTATPRSTASPATSTPAKLEKINIQELLAIGEPNE